MEDSTLQEKLLTYGETGNVLPVSERTVRGLCHKSKELPVVRVGRKCCYGIFVEWGRCGVAGVLR